MVLIGASGAGKSTLAGTWPASQVLSLDAMREAVSDDAGDQEATADAVDALHLVLERRMARRRFTVVDATNVTRAAREPLVAAAERHNVPAIAGMVSTPASVCAPGPEARQPGRAGRHGPSAAQGDGPLPPAAQGGGLQRGRLLRQPLPVAAVPGAAERVPDRRPRLDGGDGLGGLLLVRRTFGAEIVPLWRWKPGSNVAGGDRVAEIRLGQMYLTLALRQNVDGEGDIGFDVMLPCPHDDECTAYVWAPAYSITSLFQALNGDLDGHEDIVCTVHGSCDDVDQEADDHTNNSGQEVDPEGHADHEAQAMEAVRG
ncbi:AAA family ATPase [Streptomyces mirabilis]|uniref:AAA family ATPase n=1 Tax=Streptomyces mirabilis TaxID=68239 RepID=UPI0033193FCF